MPARQVPDGSKYACGAVSYTHLRKAANIISAQVIMKPDCVLGLATGGTPVGTYEKLVERYNDCLLYTSRCV